METPMQNEMKVETMRCYQTIHSDGTRTLLELNVNVSDIVRVIIRPVSKRNKDGSFRSFAKKTFVYFKNAGGDLDSADASRPFNAVRTILKAGGATLKLDSLDTVSEEKYTRWGRVVRSAKRSVYEVIIDSKTT